MNQIFFVYRDEVVTELASSILSSKGVNAYCLNVVEENFAYLINDLNPELVLVDEKLYDDSKELIEESFKTAKTDSRWVFLTEEKERSNPFHMQFQLPLKAKSLFKDLQYLVEENLVKN